MFARQHKDRAASRDLAATRPLYRATQMRRLLPIGATAVLAGAPIAESSGIVYFKGAISRTERTPTRRDSPH